MPSALATDMDAVIGRILSHYRSTYVALPGEPVKEPSPAAAPAAPADWIAIRVLRSTSRPWNVENDQRRDLRVAIWLALQPGRSGLTDRIRTIEADLSDALGLARNAPGEGFDGRLEYVGEAAPPPNLRPSNPWDWHALFYSPAMLTIPT